MTNKFISMMDGIRQGIASVLTPRCHRSDSLSIVSRQSLLPIFLLCLTLFIGVGQMWGETVTINISTFGWNTTQGSQSASQDGITIASDNGAKNSTTQLRFYSGGTHTFTSTVGNITKVEFTCTASGTNNYGPGKMSLASGSAGSYSYNGTKGTWSGNAASFTLSGGQARCTSIVITYTPAASCTTNPTVSAGSNSSVAATTATISCSGISSLGSAGCTISSYGFVIGSSSNPSVGGSGVTKHEVGTSYTTKNTSFSKNLTGLSPTTTYYVRPYATNGNGTAYGTQTSFTTTALPKYTVTLMDDDTELEQATAGASVNLPTRDGCTGYTFAGWSTTNNTTWTTTAPTIINAGSYTPAADENLYPVYTKTEGGEETETEIFATTSLGSTNTVTSGYAVSASAEAKSGYYQDGSGTTRSVSVSKSSTATAMISTTPTLATVTATLGGGTTKNPLTNNVYAVWLDASGNELGDAVEITTKITSTTGSDFTANLPVSNATSAYGVRIKHQKETSYNVRYYAISLSITTGGSTTYYISNPNCCTQLASINGSVSWTNPTTAVVTWNKLDEQVSAWALSWSPNTAGSSITSAIADKGETQKTATVSGLACGTQYTFTLTPTTKSGVCPVTDNPTIVSTSTKYAITSADNGEPTGGIFTVSPETACGEDDITIEAAPNTGYAFGGWTITKASTGKVSPAANTAETTFTMPAEAVTVSAAFNCVEPSIVTQPANASYQQGATPAALSVAATLSSGTLTYLWKVSTNSGSTWSNASGTNNEPTYAAANISTANTGTTLYKCIVGNQQGGCEVESDVATIEVTAPSKCLTPTFTVAAGTYYEDKSVELGCNTAGVTIYYTTNNTTPTTSSSVYSSAITVTQTTTIKAIAVKAGLIDSDVAEATYTIMCETPTIVLAAGNYTGVQTTTITKGYGTKIYYTTDGSTPDNTKTEYTGAVSIDQPMTLKAIVWKDGCTNSEVASAAYTLKCTTPEFNNGTGTYTGAQSITLSGTAGADIYYTLDGTDPSKTHGTKYTAAIEVSANQTVKAIAVKEGWGDSEIASATYTIQYNVYWWVNGTDWNDKGGSTLVTYGQTATAPTTAPTKANGCGDKFMGWTTIPDYEDDDTAPTGMFTETSAAITKETNFYAVFADYGENE